MDSLRVNVKTGFAGAVVSITRFFTALKAGRLVDKWADTAFEASLMLPSFNVRAFSLDQSKSNEFSLDCGT
ncbi:hypothetical protein D3C71_2133830 [compost metagenome]